ncbi:MAG: Gfo/Idh/MocA family oxidoreductase [Planctomycetia bacterium]|nr:Gfo/Idh/MocA family oxidoreductase [Planctomycetia bacterium]
MKRRDFLNTGLALGATGLCSTILAGEAPSISAPKGFKKIRIAQIGVLHEHASGKMNSMKQLPEYFEILGIAAENPEAEKKHRNAKIYKDLKWMSKEELFALPGLEAVAVETEMTDLLPTAVQCAERGLHMHLDKPLGQELSECKKMLDVCKKHKVIVQPGYMFRTNQAFRLALKAVKNGWLGEIFDVRANMDRSDFSPGFRKWLATYRGGGMYDFGSHLVDFVVELLGAPKKIDVFEKPDPKDGLSDNTLSVLSYDRALVQLRVNQKNPYAFKKRSLTITGTKGRFELDPLECWDKDPKTGNVVPLNVVLSLQEENPEYKAGVHELKIQPFNDRYFGQLIDFAKFVRGEKKNPYSYKQELLVQKTILAASGYIPWTAE